MSTNILINSRSMNGIITISDGSAILENGNLSCDNINSNNISLVGNTIQGLVSLSTSPTYPDSTTKISTTQFVSENFCDKTTDQTILGQKTFSTGITTPLIKSIISNNIFFDFLNTTTSIPTNSTLAGLAIGWNQQGYGETNFISYGGGDTTTGGFFFSCVNQFNNNQWLVRITKSGIVFYKNLYIFGNSITNLSSLTSSPTYPDSTTQIATTSFVSSNFVDLTTDQINILGQKTFTTGITTSNISLLSNRQIFYNLIGTGTIPNVVSSLGGYSTAWNSSNQYGEVNMISYGSAGSGTGGFEFSYLNQVNTKILLARFYASSTHITFYKELTIFSNVITNLTSLVSSPLTTDNSNQIASTSFVKAQDYTTLALVQSNNNIWTGTNTFNTSLPTSTITATTTNQLVNYTTLTGQGYTTLALVQSNNNIWTGTNTFNIPITASNRLVTSQIETLSNNLILYNMFDGATTNVTTSFNGGYMTQYNNSVAGNSGVISFISNGGGGTSDTGGFELSYLNSIISKTVLATFYPLLFTFYRDLNIVSTTNSTSISTGSIVTNGGLGVALDVNCGNNLTVGGTMKSSDITTNTIAFDYTIAPFQALNELGYTTDNNGITNVNLITSIIQQVGTNTITIGAGTWHLEYNITIIPNPTINLFYLASGFSTSPSIFNNHGKTYLRFKVKVSCSNQTITSPTTINYSQIFKNPTGNLTLYLVAYASINSGAGYYYNSNSLYGVLTIPTSYLQATRIA